MALHWNSIALDHPEGRHDIGTPGGEEWPKYTVYRHKIEGLLDPQVFYQGGDDKEREKLPSPAFRGWRDAQVFCEDHYSASAPGSNDLVDEAPAKRGPGRPRKQPDPEPENGSDP